MLGSWIVVDPFRNVLRCPKISPDPMTWVDGICCTISISILQKIGKVWILKGSAAVFGGPGNGALYRFVTFMQFQGQKLGEVFGVCD